MASVPTTFGYGYVPGPFQYSAGVAALPGFTIERVRLAEPVALAAGFARAERYMAERGLPFTAFAACELRSPAPFDDDGFRRFNRMYVQTLERWGIVKGEANPVARSNTCPAVDPPPVPSLHAFSLVVPGGPADSFVISGGAEALEGAGPYSSRTVRHGDESADALKEKAAFVLGQMERRMAAFGRGWGDTTGVQVYTLRDIHPLFADAIAARGASRHGLTWHYNRPPIEGLDFEMDCRGVTVERVIA